MNETALAWTFGMAAGIAATICWRTLTIRDLRDEVCRLKWRESRLRQELEAARQCAQQDQARRKRAERELKHKERFRWN